MTRLIIHTGWHKTGTSSVQSFFLNHPDALADAGWLYLSSPNHHKLRMTKVVFDDGVPQVTTSVRQLERAFKKNAELIASADGVVVSNENLSWLSSRSELERLRDTFAAVFSEITVLTYIRRQDQLAVSHKQQGARLLKGRSGESARGPAAYLYDHQQRALPTPTKPVLDYLDFEYKVGLWGDVFGDSQISLRVFEPARLDQNDIVCDALGSMGITVDGGKVVKNQSFGRLKTLAMQSLYSPDREHHEALYRVQRAMRHGDRTKLQPGRREAQAFYEHFREANERLNRRFAVNDGTLFDEDFRGLPEVGTHELNTKDAEQLVGLLGQGVTELAGLWEQERAARREAELARKRDQKLASQREHELMRQIQPGRKAIRRARVIADEQGVGAMLKAIWRKVSR